MSVIIKSNQVSSINFGQSAMLGTTPQAEFDKYKARVAADGGVVKDEARTLSAFELLFENKMYGNMNTFVSGTFGVKTDSDGGVNMLYAIDGIDLEGKVYGTGSLPTLTPDNNISFSANGGTAEAANGGLFTTTNPMVMSKTGSFGMGVRLIENGDIIYRYLAALTKHDDAVSSTHSTILATKVISGKPAVNFSMQTDPYTINKTTGMVTVEQQTSERTTAFLTDPLSNTLYALRGGIQTLEAVGKTFTQITSEPFYLDFGGSYISARKNFNSGVVRDFMCYRDATIEQAKKLSLFNA